MDDWDELAPIKAASQDSELHQTSEVPDSAPDGAPPVGPPPNPDDERVLAEIDRLQRKKANWLTTFLILIVSGALFYGIGAAAWSWKLAALLIPILLIHELGHYLAMLVFRYRNLRMFFIPLIGAAVIGRHYNVPAWKKAVVSLMGPLPGIAVGTALGIAAIFLKHELLLEVATLTVVLNGFNLLPILPLDGGWTLHALLFSRHVLLDAGFRVVTGLALIIGAISLDQYFLAYLGVAMLIAIPAAYRMATIAARLRAKGVKARSPDSESIPEDAAREIIGEVRGAFPTRVTDKNYARMTIQIFEALNSRPAGWFATLFLGGVHLSGFAVALVAACVFFVASRADLGQFLREAADMPQNAYTCGTTSRKAGARPASATGPCITLIGNFDSEKKAKQAYGELTASELPEDVAVTLFGQTVFVTLPPDDGLRREWEAQLKPLCREYRVADRGSSASWTLVCIARTESEAEALEQEMNTYFILPTRLVPPWSTTIKLKRAQRKARTTYAKLLAAENRLRRSPATDFDKVLANLTKDRAALDKWQQEFAQLQHEATIKALEEVRHEGEPAVDLETTKLYEAWSLPPKKEAAQESIKRFDRLAERMGELPRQNRKITAGFDRESAWFGRVTRTGLLLRFDNLAFTSAGDALPALAEWLCSRHCLSIKYRLRPLTRPVLHGVQPVDADDGD
jgi:Zn-dependent protease